MPKKTTIEQLNELEKLADLMKLQAGEIIARALEIKKFCRKAKVYGKAGVSTPALDKGGLDEIQTAHLLIKRNKRILKKAA